MNVLCLEGSSNWKYEIQSSKSPREADKPLSWVADNIKTYYTVVRTGKIAIQELTNQNFIIFSDWHTSTLNHVPCNAYLTVSAVNGFKKSRIRFYSLSFSIFSEGVGRITRLLLFKRLNCTNFFLRGWKTITSMVWKSHVYWPWFFKCLNWLRFHVEMR